MGLSLPQHLETDRHVWQAFRYHSRTFSWAARLLPPPVRMPVATLYLFCRTVDTLADERVLEMGAAQALEELHALRAGLDATLAGRPPERMMWQRLHAVHQQFALLPEPLYELIDGAAWDLEGRPIRTHDDLIAYSNLVGGSIGAMMLPFLLDNHTAARRAERPARALGIAMQITNILRDVGEDRRTVRRTYLPQTTLRRFGLTEVDLDGPALPPAYPHLLESLMAVAEDGYREGIAGIGVLPLRMRAGIRAAAHLYREILNEVRANAYDNLSRRAYVPAWRKGLLLLHDGYADRKRRLLPGDAHGPQEVPAALPATPLSAPPTR